MWGKYTIVPWICYGFFGVMFPTYIAGRGQAGIPWNYPPAQDSSDDGLLFQATNPVAKTFDLLATIASGVGGLYHIYHT